MIAEWYAMPRATWKARLWASLYGLMWVWLVWTQWPQLHADLAIARWIAWSFVVIAVVFLPPLLIIVVFGRVPRFYQYFGWHLSKTVPQIRADIDKEQQERDERPRRL